MTHRDAAPVPIVQNAAAAIPTVLTGFLTLVALLPLHSSVLQLIAPSLPLVALYYWAVHRPDLMPRLAVFLIGLAIDIFHATPIGATALSYVVVYEVVVRNRRHVAGKPFWALWAGMAGAASAAYAVQWALTSAFKGIPVPHQAVVSQVGISVALFPWLIWPLLTVQRRLLHRV